MSAPNPEELALRRAIAAGPDEDTPRLAYADWLDEHPDPKKCWACNGKGWLLGAGPDRGNPPCDKCLSEKVIDLNTDRAAFVRAQITLDGTPVRARQTREMPTRQWHLLDPGWIKTHEAVFVLRDGSYVDGIGHMTYTDTNPEYVRLGSVVNGLFDRHGRAWFPDILSEDDTAVSVRETTAVNDVIRSRPGVVFALFVRRGFPEIVYTPLEHVNPAGCVPTWVRTYPIRTVRYTNRGPSVTRQRSGGRHHRHTWFVQGAHDGGPWTERDARPYLPPALMPDPTRRRNNYDTEDAAWEAASRRALRFMREQPLNDAVDRFDESLRPAEDLS